MTAQAGEKIYYKGEWHSMATEPLRFYLDNLEKKPILRAPSTGLWRGYVGSWEVKDDKLYLVSLVCFGENFEKKNMEYLFQDTKEVFASWFSGKIRIPTGLLLKYVHGGYESVYERDIFLEFKDGCYLSSETIENPLPEDDEFDLSDELPF